MTIHFLWSFLLYCSKHYLMGQSNWFPIVAAPDGPPENVRVVATSPYGINISWSEPAVITGPTFYLIDVKSVRHVLPPLKGSIKHSSWCRLFSQRFWFCTMVLSYTFHRLVSVGVDSVVTNCSTIALLQCMFLLFWGQRLCICQKVVKFDLKYREKGLLE